VLERGRGLLHKQAWSAAFSQLSSADREEPLEPEDLLQLASAAYLIGKEADSVNLLARAHQDFLSRGQMQHAARCALRLGFIYLFNSERAQAGGWISRASRLLEGQRKCVEHGYLLLPVAYNSVREGRPEKAFKVFSEAEVIGNHFGDRDLVSMALQGQGRALIRQGEIARGLTLLDEAMVAVTSGEVSPLIAATIYCSVIDSCQETFDLGRAQEWTAALDQWYASQPDMVRYRGHCLLQRAEIMQHRGEWRSATEEAQQACEWLSQPTPKPILGAAFYRLAELHRLRGEFAEAEEAYRQASQWERCARPGFAQLHLALGRVDAANSAIRRIIEEEAQEPGSRAKALEAYVEIMLAADDVSLARAGADELSKIAQRHGALFLLAMSARANASVLLAEGDPRNALAALRQSWTLWCELEMPYEAARVRVLIASACREQGDDASADVELAAARKVFQQLGAAYDLARLDALSRKNNGDEGPLTAREVQVLKLVASGTTNRGIAGKLKISEKTVARHLSNIFNKLDLNSRAAATAYAYQHKLV
jgi:ATP/maltotriose-dependent transcriptional regulator MalT